MSGESEREVRAEGWRGRGEGGGVDEGGGETRGRGGGGGGGGGTRGGKGGEGAGTGNERRSGEQRGDKGGSGERCWGAVGARFGNRARCVLSEGLLVRGDHTRESFLHLSWALLGGLRKQMAEDQCPRCPAGLDQIAPEAQDFPSFLQNC